MADSPRMSMEKEGSLGWIVLIQPVAPEMRDLAKVD